MWIEFLVWFTKSWGKEAMPAVINDLFVGSSWGRLLCCIREIDLSNLFTLNQWDRQGRKEQNVFISPVVLKIMVDFHVLMLRLLFSSGGHQILVNYMTDVSERSLECYDESVPYWLLLSRSFRSVNQSRVTHKEQSICHLINGTISRQTLNLYLCGNSFHIKCVDVRCWYSHQKVWVLKHETWLAVLF